MKKLKKSLFALILLLAILTLGVSADTAYVTKDDPLVSLSYVNNVLGPQIMAQVMEKVESEYIKISDISNVNSGQYSLVTLNKNQTLTSKSASEVVILQGSGVIVITSNDNIQASQGIVDLTDGKMLLNGGVLPLNHYLVIPKADGRGFYATSDTLTVLIRGEYNITD